MANQFFTSPLAYMEMSGGRGGGGTSIPLNTEAPNFLRMYMAGMAMKNQRDIQQSQLAENAARTQLMQQETQKDTLANQQTQLTTQGLDAYGTDGSSDDWKAFQKKNPGLANQIQDHVQITHAANLLQNSHAVSALLQTMPPTSAGFNAYNSPQTIQQFQQAGLPHPTYKNLQEYTDGWQEMFDKTQSVFAKATTLAHMTREYTDPHSPYFHNSGLYDQMQVMKATANSIVEKNLSIAGKNKTQATKPANLPSTKDLTLQVTGVLQANPKIKDWMSQQADKGKNMAGEIAATVRSGMLNGAYKGMTPDAAIQAEMARVGTKDTWGGLGTPDVNYTPAASTGAGGPAPTGTGPVAAPAAATNGSSDPLGLLDNSGQ